MDWYIVHTGIEMLDALHTIGYAVWLASRYQTTVNIVNDGAYARLTIDEDEQHLHPQSVELTRILRIPHADELSADQSSIDEFALHNLDGLLALLFTTSGVRVVSVDDLRTKIERDPAIIVSTLKKITSKISRWKQYLEQNSITPDEIDTWYRQQRLVLLVDKPKAGLGLPMTIDPALSHSHRSSVSAGLISDKNRLSTKPDFIPILVYIRHYID